MPTTQISTGLYLDKRRKTNQKTYPIKVRVSQQHIRKYYSIGLYSTVEDWKKITTTHPRGELKNLKDKANNELQKVCTFIINMKQFSFRRLEKDYFGKTPTDNILVHLFKVHIDALNAEGRISSGECYYNAMSSLKRFKESIRMEDITPKFLSNYEAWMLSKKNSITTVGIYLRSLRTIINIAKEQQLISGDDYPFGKRKYQIPQGRNIKKSLTQQEIEKIFNHKTCDFSSEDKAKDFWIFSYLANGMNIKDICKLKYKNLVHNLLLFQRAKTERFNRGAPIFVNVIVNPIMQKIISKWGNTNKSSENFIFPILPDDLSPKQEREAIKSFIKSVNNGMSKITTAVGIETRVTTYSARHSFATTLRNSGIPIGFIKESLGHKNIQTTEHYLDAYPEETRKKYIDSLTSFFGNDSEDDNSISEKPLT
jgi:integrase/recombinase XerD